MRVKKILLIIGTMLCGLSLGNACDHRQMELQERRFQIKKERKMHCPYQQWQRAPKPHAREFQVQVAFNVIVMLAEQRVGNMFFPQN